MKKGLAKMESSATSTMTATMELLLHQSRKLQLQHPTSSARYTTGATNAIFKEGAEVSKIGLPSDYSTLQLTDLPSGAQAQVVIEILSAFGFEVPASSIRVKPMKRSGSIATITFDDPDTARLIAERITEAIGDGGDGTGELSAKVIPGTAKLGSRMQLSSVNCSW
jgi:hypothetical protein